MNEFLSLYEESGDYQPGSKKDSPLCDQLPHASEVYSDENLIAKGGMKSIYKVFCNSSHRFIAKATLNDPSKFELRDAFIREARLTALLDHPNIIKIYQIALTEKNEPFFTMELKTGSSLETFIQEPRTRDKLLDIFIKICDGISYAHSRKVLHLDLKPDNIQVGSFGEVIICDWGLGKILTRQVPGEKTESFQLDADMLNHCTIYGEVKGTPAYMAPEQLKGADKNERTDIYSLGALLFTLLSPKRLSNSSLKERLNESREGISTNLEGHDIPPSLMAVIRKAMSLKMSDRYETVELLKKDIERYLNTYPTEAQEADFLTHSKFLWRRNKKVCLIISAAIIVIFCSLLLFLKQIKMSEEKTILALNESKLYATKLEKSLQENKNLEKSIHSLPKKIVDRIFADNQEHRDYQLLMTPKISLERSNQYLKAAYETKPDNLYIIRALAANYFIAMDFEGFAEFYKRHEKVLVFFAPYFDYFKDKSPSDNIENTFNEFEMMTGFASRLPILMELIIAYHADKFNQHPKFPAIIASLIFHYYPDSSKIELNLKNNRLEVWGPKLKNMTSPITKLSLLRYLKFKDLFIADNSIDHAKEFSGLNLRQLQIQHTKITDLTPLLALPSLNHVTIHDGQVDEQQLENFSQHFSKDLLQVHKAIKANFSGGADINYNHNNYTSGGFLDGFYKNKNAIVSFDFFSNKAQQETLLLRYSAGYKDAEVIVECNTTQNEILLKSTKSWEAWDTFELPLNFLKGLNKVSLKMKHSSPNCFNLDSISRKVSPKVIKSKTLQASPSKDLEQ